jgi:hypothetical protein
MEDPGIAAVDPDTGAVAELAEEIGFGAAALADGRIYYLGQKGEAALLEPKEGSAKIVGRFRLTKPKENDAWAHPAICRGRLYLRYHEMLSAYDIRRSQGGKRSTDESMRL